MIGFWVFLVGFLFVFVGFLFYLPILNGYKIGLFETILGFCGMVCVV